MTATDVAWDLAGAIPDVGALGSAAQSTRYMRMAKVAGAGRLGRCTAARSLWSSHYAWQGAEETFQGAQFIGVAGEAGKWFNDSMMGEQ